MKVRYTFTVYADTQILEGEDPEIVRTDAIKHIHHLLNTKCDFSDVDFELVNTEIVED
jgi:hypothetical protein